MKISAAPGACGSTRYWGGIDTASDDHITHVTNLFDVRCTSGIVPVRAVMPGRKGGTSVARWSEQGHEPAAMRTEDGAIMCPCGDRLADSISGDTVVIDGAELQFRRRNDEIVCRTCGVSHPVRQFRGSSAPTDTGRRRRATD